MQIVSNVALISINETLLVQLISFLIFLFVINRLMFRPLRSTMAQREFYVQEMETEIEDAEKNYDRALAEIKERESEVRTAAFKLSREQEEAGSREAEEIFQSARREIAAMKQKTEIEITAQIAEARKAVRAESDTLAVAIMEKVLDRSLSS